MVAIPWRGSKLPLNKAQASLRTPNRAFGMRMRGHVWGKNNVWFWSYGAFDTGCCCPHPDPFWRL
jgi:hypothetical protein